MAILDEAGNICRIPDKYTTYGSRGIIVITILQTQEQTALGNLSPVEFERLHIPAATAA